MLVKWETSAWIGLMIQNRMYGDDVLFKSFVSAKIYDFMKLICLQVYDFSNWHMPLTLGSKRGFFTYCLSPLTYCLNDYLNNFFFNFEKALWNIITNLYNIILIVLQYSNFSHFGIPGSPGPSTWGGRRGIPGPST